MKLTNTRAGCLLSETQDKEAQHFQFGGTVAICRHKIDSCLEKSECEQPLLLTGFGIVFCQDE